MLGGAGERLCKEREFAILQAQWNFCWNTDGTMIMKPFKFNQIVTLPVPTCRGFREKVETTSLARVLFEHPVINDATLREWFRVNMNDPSKSLDSWEKVLFDLVVNKGTSLEEALDQTVYLQSPENWKNINWTLFCYWRELQKPFGTFPLLGFLKPEFFSQDCSDWRPVLDCIKWVPELKSAMPIIKCHAAAQLCSLGRYSDAHCMMPSLKRHLGQIQNSNYIENPLLRKSFLQSCVWGLERASVERINLLIELELWLDAELEWREYFATHTLKSRTLPPINPTFPNPSPFSLLASIYLFIQSGGKRSELPPSLFIRNDDPRLAKKMYKPKCLKERVVFNLICSTVATWFPAPAILECISEDDKKLLSCPQII